MKAVPKSPRCSDGQCRLGDKHCDQGERLQNVADGEQEDEDAEDMSGTGCRKEEAGLAVVDMSQVEGISTLLYRRVASFLCVMRNSVRICTRKQ